MNETTKRVPTVLLHSTVIKKRRLNGIGRLRLRLDVYSNGSKLEECSIEVTKAFADSWDSGNRYMHSRDIIDATWSVLVESGFSPSNSIVLRYDGREFWTAFITINPETGKPFGYEGK